MGKKRKLKKQMRKREVTGPALVICVGKDCAPRAETRALRDDMQAYAGDRLVGVEVVRCLHVCKKGPIIATFPKITFHKRVTSAQAHALIDEVSAG